MTSQPPTDPPARPSINQAARRYSGSQRRNVTPGPRPTPAPDVPPPAPDVPPPDPAPSPSAPGPPAPSPDACPDRRRHDRRLLLLRRVQYAAITLALMVATGATVALLCTHR